MVVHAVSEAPLLEMRSITKEFPGVKALSDVSLTVGRPEIHSICGENGAGKSTLMKVLSGVYPYGSYDGDIVYKGELVQFRNIGESEAVGIVIIHQELALIPELSIMENMFLGNEPRKWGGTAIDWTTARRRCIELMERVGLDERPDIQIKNIGVGKQQLVEIAKALSKDVELLILDEPTAALNDKDSQHLLGLMQGLKDGGVSCIMISHKLNEIEQISDKITIIRDGKTIETLDAEGANEDRIIKGMVGREMNSRYPTREKHIGEVFFEVRDIWVKHPIADDRYVCKGSSLKVRHGEVVGIAGLMGAGRTELAMSIFGRSYGIWESGTIIKDGQEIELRHVRDAIEPRRRLRERGPQDPRPEPPRRHQDRHGPGQVEQGEHARGDRQAQGVRRRRGLPQAPAHQDPLGQRGRGQALGRQPAEGRAEQVDVHRLRPADPR